MTAFMLLGVAVALAMDAFAVSLAIALSLQCPNRGQTFRLAFNFGIFQFFMPIAGWLAGRGLVGHIQDFDHWVAFGLLAFIGGKMLYESTVIGRGEGEFENDPTQGASLIILSIATSIDALAVGLSLCLINVNIVYPAVVIGVVCFALTVVGMRVGPLAGRIFGKRVEAGGGIILLLIGLKILVDHLLG
jgi:putative Mn2+ efflux pump MntP